MNTILKSTNNFVHAIIIVSLFVLSACGQHEMDSMHGMDTKKETMSKSMDDSMMATPEKKMEDGAMMEEVEIEKPEAAM